MAIQQVEQVDKDLIISQATQWVVNGTTMKALNNSVCAYVERDICTVCDRPLCGLSVLPGSSWAHLLLETSSLVPHPSFQIQRNSLM